MCFKLLQALEVDKTLGIYRPLVDEFNGINFEGNKTN